MNDTENKTLPIPQSRSTAGLELTLHKPRKGDACNGCGMCCSVQPCALAAEFLHCTTGPCVALEYEDGRTFCGFVRRPVHYLMAKDAPPSITGTLQAHLAGILGLGHGCDSDDEF